jgi:hypothetical protein
MLSLYTLIILIAEYRAVKARKAVEFNRLDDAYDYTTSQNRIKAETLSTQNAMRVQAQFMNSQAIFQQELQERADTHEDNRMAKRLKLRKNMLESSMEQQHGRSMEFITEKTHSEQSSKRLLLISDSSHDNTYYAHQQNSSSSSEIVRSSSNSKFPPGEEEVCDDEDEQQLKAYFAGK